MHIILLKSFHQFIKEQLDFCINIIFLLRNFHNAFTLNFFNNIYGIFFKIYIFLFL